MAHKKKPVDKNVVITLNEDEVHDLVGEHLRRCDALFYPEKGNGEYDEKTKVAIAQEVVEQLNSGGSGIYFNKTKKNQIPALIRQADRGDAEAQYRLGQLYYMGKLVPKDYAMAGQRFVQAAVQGHAEAQFCLGKLYEWGYGVPRDRVSAYMWLSLAAAHERTQTASFAVNNLTGRGMTPAQIAEAQRLAQQLKDEIQMYRNMKESHDKHPTVLTLGEDRGNAVLTELRQCPGYALAVAAQKAWDQCHVKTASQTQEETRSCLQQSKSFYREC